MLDPPTTCHFTEWVLWLGGGALHTAPSDLCIRFCPARRSGPPVALQAEVAGSPPPPPLYTHILAWTHRSQLNVCVSFSENSDLTSLLSYSTEDLGVCFTELLNSISQPVTWQKTHRNQQYVWVSFSGLSAHNKPSELLHWGLGSRLHWATQLQQQTCDTRACSPKLPCHTTINIGTLKTWVAYLSSSNKDLEVAFLSVKYKC